MSDWRDRAACREVDPEVWYPDVPGRDARALSTLPAKAVCARCPVQAECLSWALETDQRWGVWGGVDMQSDDERPAAS